MFDTLITFIKKNNNSDSAIVRSTFSDKEIAESVVKLTKQMIIADGRIKTEEVNAAKTLLSSNDLSIIENKLKNKKLQSSELIKTPLFHLMLVLRDSISQEELIKLKEQLILIALSDGEFHEDEKKIIELFETITGCT